MKFRIGFGYDVHRLQQGRKCILGGVHIPYHKGPAGHSDGDVLIHAICDALLGAAALGDIGRHFPDSDPAYRNADSRNFLKKTRDMIRAEGYSVTNVDCTLCLQEPKIQPHTGNMRKIISETLGISTGAVSIKATTTEKLGFVGEGKGVSAYASVLLCKNSGK